MKAKSETKRKLKLNHARRGIERKHMLDSGNIWMPAPMIFEDKSKYNRKREKFSLRKEISKM